MKRTTQILFVSTLMLGLGVRGSAQQKKEPVDYVNPNIGGHADLTRSPLPKGENL